MEKYLAVLYVYGEDYYNVFQCNSIQEAEDAIEKEFEINDIDENYCIDDIKGYICTINKEMTLETKGINIVFKDRSKVRGSSLSKEDFPDFETDWDL